MRAALESLLPIVLTAATLVALPSGAATRAQGEEGLRRKERDPGRSRAGIAARLRRLPIVVALDADGDAVLSPAEITGATGALLSLDANGDGNLTKEELELPPQPRLPPLEPFIHLSPIVRAIDLDADNELFEDEVTEASEHLRVLDENGDGVLDEAELAMHFGLLGEFRNWRRTGVAPQPDEMDPKDAVAIVPDRDTFRMLAYQGPEVMLDKHLYGVEYVKIQLEGVGTEDPRLYFINTKTHRSHYGFMRNCGIPIHPASGRMRGVVVYRPMVRAPNGELGLYTYEWEPQAAPDFEMVKIAHDLLAEHSALMRGRLAYNPVARSKEKYRTERTKYKAARLAVFDEADEYAAIGFLPLHSADSYGLLRLMTTEELPSPRDVVIYRTLPNEMPKVAGIITTVRQTPLSHVNLRALQDHVPNAYIADAIHQPAIADLIGSYVYYRVSANGYEIREATPAEVEAHLADHRPAEPQVLPRDLSVTTIRPLGEIGFGDAGSVGVKAANMAALRGLGLGEDRTPDGYAVPFSFYDAFMKHNGFYAMARTMIADPDFQSRAATRAKSLEAFRKAIKKGEMPDWMMSALDAVQVAFPPGISIRCRSSTNNEDLPGFSGAGLYDSYTHHPYEGHLAKSIKQVFASLWNFRAYESRAYHRIDHFSAAMGVLLHPNADAEQVNGVAVTDDIIYGNAGQAGRRYYVNAQRGEDLVTQPGDQSVPEEILLSPRNPRLDRVLQRSNLVAAGDALLSPEHLMDLRRSLRTIHKEFSVLYGVSPDSQFAMEVEFKITAKGHLLIKQARPWVY